MGLKTNCPKCGLKTIPRRIIGVYVGSADSIKIWECRECLALWTNSQHRQKIQVGEVHASSA